MTVLKRLFFGLKVDAPWPDQFPKGRILDPDHRHLTLAFIGNTDYKQMEQALFHYPQPICQIGFAGIFSQCLFLPSSHPRVVAWDVQLFDRQQELVSYVFNLQQWLEKQGCLANSKKDFLAHVTIARDPLNLQNWKKSFACLPLIATSIHLYESLGNSKYKSLWSYPLVPPFQEIEHMADIAFLIRGKNYQELFLHAAVALSFQFPSLSDYISPTWKGENLDELILTLNDLIARADCEWGCPFKAVSFHSELKQKEKWIEWEMIIDV